MIDLFSFITEVCVCKSHQYWCDLFDGVLFFEQCFWGDFFSPEDDDFVVVKNVTPGNKFENRLYQPVFL